jgi:formylglycine-generating enzyme required for sulfatase activity
MPQTRPGGPLIVADGTRRDRVELDDTVFDLVGNVREYCLDTFNRQDEPCWSKGGVYRDPVCTASSTQRVVRGGSWLDYPAQGTAATRRSVADDAMPIDTGMRCVRSGTP